jgi:hypothetical protein
LKSGDNKVSIEEATAVLGLLAMLDRREPAVPPPATARLPEPPIIGSAASRSRKNPTTFSVWALTTP